MKKLKKILATGFACLVVSAISIPVIASNMQEQDHVFAQDVNRTDIKNVVVENSVSNNVKRYSLELENDIHEKLSNYTNTTTDSKKEKTEKFDTKNDAVEEKIEKEKTDDMVGDNTIDEMDVIDVDTTEAEPETPEETIENTVDEQTHGLCAYFYDDNGDGLCDHCTGTSSNDVCPNYYDDNGDGLCDHCTGGSGWSGGSGHHGGGHHGGRHH